jgi:hypothetical protein
MPAINIRDASAGGNINSTFIAQQTNYIITNSTANGDVDPDILAEFTNRSIVHLNNGTTDTLGRLSDAMCARVRDWEQDVQRMLDCLDGPNMHRASAELEEWLGKNEAHLTPEYRARCLKILARIEIFFAGSNEQEKGA